RQRAPDRVPCLRALVRRPVRPRPVHARAAAGQARARAPGVGGRLPRAEPAAAAEAEPARAAARGDLVELARARATRTHAIVPGPGARARAASFAAARGPVRGRPARAVPEPEIVFVGRVNRFKGLGVAIEALAILRAGGHPGARLVVIGPEQEPDYVAEMRALISSRGLDGAVTWRGQLGPEQTAAALASAHAMIVPSTWEEPFG